MFQIAASFDEDPQSMQGFVLTNGFLGSETGQLSTDKDSRELVVENIQESDEVQYLRVFNYS